MSGRLRSAFALAAVLLCGAATPARPTDPKGAPVAAPASTLSQADSSREVLSSRLLRRRSTFESGLAEPDSVLAFRVNGQQAGARADHGHLGFLGPSTRVTQWLPFERDEWESIRASLLRKSNFAPRFGMRGCAFDPEYGFRVLSGRDTSDVLICFACDRFEASRPDGLTLVGDFDDSEWQLVHAMLRVWPNDSTLLRVLRRNGRR